MSRNVEVPTQGTEGVFINGFRVKGFSGFVDGSKWYTLPRGPFKISGRMGAGKTSMARLILFGLTGDLKIIEDYLSEDVGVVEIELADTSGRDVKLVRVIREVSRSPESTLTLRSRVVNPETGELIAENGGVQSFLESFMGEPVLDSVKDVFILRSDLEKSYQQLREKVKSLTYLDLAERLKEDLDSLKSSLRMRVEELEGELASFEEYLADEGVSSPERSGTLSEYAKRLKELFVELTSKWMKELEELKAKINSLEREQESLQARVEELESKRMSLENLASSIKVKEEQVELMRKAYEDAVRRISQLEKEVELLEEDLRKADEKVRRTKEAISSISKRLDDIKAGLLVEADEGDRGAYAERERQLIEAISRLKPELESLKEQLKVKEFNLSKDVISLQKIVDAYLSLRSKIKELPESINDTASLSYLREKFFDELEKSVKPTLSTLSFEARFLKEFKAWLERKGFCPLCHAETADFSKELRELERHVEDVDKRVRQLQARQKELQEVLKEVDKAIELQRSYVELSASVKAKESEVEELRRRMQEVEENVKTYELRLEAVRKRLEGLDDALKELEKERFKLKSELEKALMEREEGMRAIESLKVKVVEAKRQLVEAQEKAAKMKMELEAEEEKLESLKRQYLEGDYAAVKKEVSDLRRKVGQIKALKESLQKRVGALEVKVERFSTLVKELEKRENRIASVEKMVKLAELASNFLNRLEENAKKEFFEVIAKDLPKVGELLGIKDFQVDTGVLERLVLGRKLSQKVHTLSDGEFISLLSLISGLLGAWSGRKKRFLILDVPLDEETAFNLVNVLREMSCLQPGFIFSKPGSLKVEPFTGESSS